MPTLKQSGSQFMGNPEVYEAVSTRAASDLTIQSNAIAEAWYSIEGQLIDWGCVAGGLDDDGIPLPSRETVRDAILLANVLNRGGYRAPARVVCDANGGIVFEFGNSSSDHFMSCHVEPSGDIEARVFQNHRLVTRESWYSR